MPGMAGRFNDEFKVGLFVIVVIAALVGVYFFTYDGLFAGPGTYSVTLRAPRADGLNQGTAVKLAGVNIGSVRRIGLAGGEAEVELILDKRYQLPIDSIAELKATGLLGDTFVMVTLGDDEMAFLQDGDRIRFGRAAGDLDNITRQIEEVSTDVAAITKVLREMVEDRQNRDNVEATLENTSALTEELRRMAESNQRDIRAIVQSIRRLSESLEGVVEETGRDLDEEFDKIKLATDTLQESLDNMSSITGKVDRGEGTVGALINERDTVDSINDAFDGVTEIVESWTGLQADVYNWNRFYFGTNPSRGPGGVALTDEMARELFPPFGDNRYNMISGHAIGVDLRPQEDFWYTFELIAHPIGSITHNEYQLPSRFGGGESTFFQEWRVTQAFRYSFMINKRWYDFAFRVGVKESSGGAGLTYFAAQDRLQFHADLFDWTYGGYPAINDPDLLGFNTRFLVRYEPRRGLFFEAGTENIVPGLRYGYFTGFAGAGFHFNDNDIKLLLAALPIGR
ncbi:MAG: MCE family protein [Deltaproteobacteria bacterium]|nr:MAG: MCE family protein [Deltaproteobacteria bacterium]